MIREGDLLRCLRSFIFIFVLQSFAVQAADLRAQWLNSGQILYKLSPGVYVNNQSQFSLVDGAQSVKTGSVIPLPILSVRNNEVLLDTSALSKNKIDTLLSLALKVVLTTSSRQIVDSSALQYAGILDELYYYDGHDLGGSCDVSKCGLKLWAPTAQRVRVFLFPDTATALDQAQILNLQHSDNGTWSLDLPLSFKEFYYLYEVQVYQPSTDRIETQLVVDPYSKSLSVNSTLSQLVDLQGNAFMPAGWQNMRKPNLSTLKESVLYELHIRDFSVEDDSIPADLRGTYLAFTQKNSRGMRHLKSLADAGLTHIHLLPFNDFGSVNEDKSLWENYQSESLNLQEPQSVLGGIRHSDPFNWGYDPVLYMVPEGSYAIRAEGAERALEVRSMVQALNQTGLRVVQDVVFNHTYENASHPLSVFDKIVPGYYYRLNDLGQYQKSSCCYDTASEHRMMEKLMIDSLVHWAKTYKLDGFRFDLMSFHSRTTMEKIRQTLRSLTLAKDGVDGSKLLLYGEGWSFGSFFGKAPTESMTLENSYGTDYGFFNDRLRDAVRGGTTNSVEKSDQGFATGLFFDFNKEPANRNTPTNLDDQKYKLLHLGDVIKAGLAGNLRDYLFKEQWGSMVRAGDLRFRNSPVAVASQALETINYVSAHDGYGLWDAVQAKAPFYTSGRTPSLASLEDRQRMHHLALAIPLLGQGIPFVESGTELLRSKNGDQDSYDSGDFFNRIDWSGTTNHWGEGLPPAWKNIDDWSFWQPRLLEPALRATPSAIAKTNEYFKALLRLRKSSALFHLNSLNEISHQVSFIDNDHQAMPGLIAMHLQNTQEALLVFFNASREARDFAHPLLQQNWALHPLFDEKIDPALSEVNLISGKITLPGRSTVVLKLRPSMKRPR
ncbi:alpha-1,6-glucosidase domain-containing protein [Bdellovibrio sp. HCB337]|uniref:alpha-1,6-glucosidase domain-containing protein n=1 Tax=Bdellovibrio sp. HCB337 TaxID=3394358 RepID=UPI0039A4FC12